MEQSQKLPVKSLSKQAFLLPFRHFPLFVRFALVPVVLTILSQFVCRYLASRTEHRYLYLLWLLPFWLLSVPFSVGWIKLAVEGTESIANRSSFQFGRVEERYFIASILFTTVLFGPGLISLWWAYSSGWAAIPIIVTALIFVTGIVVGWRFMFFLTTIALDRFAGLEDSWRQTKGVVLRTLGVAILSYLPIAIARPLVVRLLSPLAATGSPPLLAVVAMTDVTALFLSSAITAGAIALCYQFKMGEIPEFDSTDTQSKVSKPS
jgi:hypothetical protein